MIVGLDHSRAAQKALEWAVQEARRIDAVVEVVHVYTPGGTAQHSAPPQFDPRPAATQVMLRHEQETATADATKRRQAAQELLERAVERIGRTDVRLKPVAVGSRHPARVLIDRCQQSDAVQLVLGRHGGGQHPERFLGSVIRKCAAGADCPVTIVPGPPRR